MTGVNCDAKKSARIVVYTAIDGAYDTLKPPSPLWAADADFIAFVDNNARGDGWRQMAVCQDFVDPCRNAKIHKILSHRYFPDAEYTIWIDGNVSIISTVSLPGLLAEWLRETDLVVFKHRTRDCTYDEGVACIASAKDDPALINAQMSKYRRQGFPPKMGLAECTVLVRRNSPRIAKFNEAWFEEIRRHSRRDQLSFMYVAISLGLNYKWLPGRISVNPHFLWLKHDGGK